jgi:hypothetical protein
MADKPEIKPSIISNITNANKNARKYEKESIDIEKEQRTVLYSILGAMKERNKVEVSSRTNERTKAKVFTRITDFLNDIRDNTKEKAKSFSIWQMILIGLGAVLFSVYAKFKIVLTILGGTIKLLSKVFVSSIKFLKEGLISLFSGKFLKTTNTGKFLSELMSSGKIEKGINAILKPFKIMKDFLIPAGGKIEKGINAILKPFKIMKDFFVTVGGKMGSVINAILKPLKIMKDFFFGLGKALTLDLKIGKILTSIIKFFSGIGGFVSNLFKFISPIVKASKFLGPVMKAIPIVGWVITAITGLIDGIVGFFKAGSYFGKKKGEEVTIGERISAVLGSILSGITFGLLGSAKAWAQSIYKIGDIIMNPIDSLVIGIKKLYSYTGELGVLIVDWFKNTWDQTKQLFKDALVGMVGIGYILSDWFKEKWEQGKQIFKDTLMGISDVGSIFIDFGRNLINNIVDNIKYIFSNKGDGEDSLIGKIKNVFVNFATLLFGVVDTFWNSIKNKAKNLNPINVVKSGWNKAKDIASNRSNKNMLPDLATAKSKSNEASIVLNNSDESKINQPSNKKTESKITESNKVKVEPINLQGLNEVQRMQTFMNFLSNQFSTTMAEKIGVVLGKSSYKDLASVPVTPVEIR